MAARLTPVDLAAWTPSPPADAVARLVGEVNALTAERGQARRESMASAATALAKRLSEVSTYGVTDRSK